MRAIGRPAKCSNSSNRRISYNPGKADSPHATDSPHVNNCSMPARFAPGRHQSRSAFGSRRVDASLGNAKLPAGSPMLPRLWTAVALQERRSVRSSRPSPDGGLPRSDSSRRATSSNSPSSKRAVSNPCLIPRSRNSRALRVIWKAPTTTARRISTPLSEALATAREGARLKIYTDIAKLDQWTGGFREGELIVLTAETGTGKSLFAAQIRARACRDGYLALVL